MPVVPESDAAPRVAVISALDFENASLQALFDTPGPLSNGASPGLSLVQAGTGAQRAASAAQAALANGAAGLVSWGVAGGLHPTMAPGTVVLPAVVRTTAGQKLETDRRWRATARCRR